MSATTKRDSDDNGSPASHRPRSRERTAEQLASAVATLTRTGRKVTVAAVARAIGVSASLVHNTYPEIAAAIRKLNGKDPEAVASSLQGELEQARLTILALREENEVLDADLKKTASINRALQMEVAVLRGVAAGKVRSLISPGTPPTSDAVS
jgi:transposase-like protein